MESTKLFDFRVFGPAMDIELPRVVENLGQANSATSGMESPLSQVSIRGEEVQKKGDRMPLC